VMKWRRLLNRPDEELCPGEYNWVARQSRSLAALRRAHETPCARAEAEAMICALARQMLPAADALALRILWGTRRGRGGVLVERKREIRYVCPLTGRPKYRMRRTGRLAPYISLPRIPMVAGGPWLVEGSSRLRVGLVLHEFAHVLTFDDDRSHGEIFTAALDDLVERWGSVHAVETSEHQPAML
jgi:hypothetical protein